jgi:hypothetical protein
VTYSPEAPPQPIAELATELDRLAIDTMADWQVPGAAIAIVLEAKWRS